jgi:hypothetical protein
MGVVNVTDNETKWKGRFGCIARGRHMLTQLFRAKAWIVMDYHLIGHDVELTNGRYDFPDACTFLPPVFYGRQHVFIEKIAGCHGLSTRPRTPVFDLRKARQAQPTSICFDKDGRVAHI